jgi:hypothetical protein
VKLEVVEEVVELEVVEEVVELFCILSLAEVEGRHPNAIACVL